MIAVFYHTFFESFARTPGGQTDPSRLNPANTITPFQKLYKNATKKPSHKKNKKNFVVV